MDPAVSRYRRVKPRFDFAIPASYRRRVAHRMQIGDFARSCRLSVKALRHYDEVGLLRPDFVDPETGYRYYRREQARTALAIAMLRSIGLPIPSVRALLAGGNDAFDDV